MRHRRRRRSCLEKSELLFVATTPLHLWLLFHWLLRPTCHKNAARILFDVRKELKVTAQVQSSNMEGVHSCRDPAIVAIASWRIKLNEGHCWHAGHMLQRLYQIVQVACSPWTSERIRKCSTGAGSTRLAAQRRAENSESEMNQLLLIRSLKLLWPRLSLQPTLRKDKNKNPTCPRAWQKSQCPFWLAYVFPVSSWLGLLDTVFTSWFLWVEYAGVPYRLASCACQNDLAFFHFLLVHSTRLPLAWIMHTAHPINLQHALLNAQGFLISFLFATEPSSTKNYFASSDSHHDISKQLVDTTFVWSFCHGTFAQLTIPIICFTWQVIVPVSSVFANSSKGTEVEMSLSTPVTLSSVQTDCFKLCHLQSKKWHCPGHSTTHARVCK